MKIAGVVVAVLATVAAPAAVFADRLVPPEAALASSSRVFVLRGGDRVEMPGLDQTCVVTNTSPQKLGCFRTSTGRGPGIRVTPSRIIVLNRAFRTAYTIR